MKETKFSFKNIFGTPTVDMTVGDYKMHLVRFTVPLLISNLFQQLYNTADSLIVGKFVGKTALAAVSSSGHLIFLFISFFVGTAMGSGVLISRYFGAHDTDNMSRAIHTAVGLGMIASAIVTALGVLIAPFALQWMDTAPSVLPESTAYFRIFFAGVTADIMYNVFTGILSAVGNSRRPLLYLVISSCMNVMLDLLFVGLFGWGVAGAAIATVMSKAFSTALCLWHLLQPGKSYQLHLNQIRLYPDMVKDVLRYGIPSGVQNSVIGFANVIVQKNINAFGENAMAGCGAYSKLEGFAFLPINAFTMAISTFVSQNLGAGKSDRAEQGARFGIFTTMILAECVGIASFLLAPYLVGIFTDDPEVLAFGVLDMRTVSLFYFLLAYSHCIASVCRGSGRAYVAMTVMLSVWCVLRVVYISVIMSFTDNIQNVFFAYPLTWAVSSIIYFIYYESGKWKVMK